MTTPRHRLAIPATLTVIVLAAGGCTRSNPIDARDAVVDVAMDVPDGAPDGAPDGVTDGVTDGAPDGATDARTEVSAGDAADVAMDDTPEGPTCDPPTVDADGGRQCGMCYNPDHSRNGCANCLLSDGMAHVLC